MLRLRQGRPVPIPSVEAAEAIVDGLGPSERLVVQEVVERIVWGGPARVESGLLELAERTAADEIMLTSNVVDPDIRIRGLQSLAGAFGLDSIAGEATPALGAAG